MSIDPITGVMVVASLASGGMSLMSGLRQGVELEEQAAVAEVSALQDEVDRRRELAELLSANTAAAASSGRTGGVGSLETIREENERIAAIDISNIRFLGSSSARSLKRQAANARLKGVGDFVGSVASAGKFVNDGLKPSGPTAPPSPPPRSRRISPPPAPPRRLSS